MEPSPKSFVLKTIAISKFVFAVIEMTPQKSFKTTFLKPQHKYSMRLHEIKTIKPPTPEQSRINSLKQQKDRATDALKAERARQKRTKALANISKNNQVLAKLNK